MTTTINVHPDPHSDDVDFDARVTPIGPADDPFYVLDILVNTGDRIHLFVGTDYNLIEFAAAVRHAVNNTDWL